MVRAGRVYDVTAQGDVCKRTGGRGAAEAPVAWTGASGAGQTEGGTRGGPGGTGMR